MTIGVIAACGPEIIPFLEKLQAVTIQKEAGLRVHLGRFAGVKVAAVCCGIGKVNAALAAQLLVSRFSVDRMIMTGVGGGMDPLPRIGDTVIATEVAYHDLDASILTENQPHMERAVFIPDAQMVETVRALEGQGAFGHKLFYGPVVTGDQFIDQDGREEINRTHRPLSVDMESAAVAHVCYVNEIPVLIVRSISDVEDESGMSVFEQHVVATSLRSLAVVEAVIKEMGAGKRI